MSEILIATKVTKTNKVVELLKMWNDKSSFASTSSIEELFLERIGCDCILYYHNTYYDMETKRKDCRKEVYAIFAEIKEKDNHREGGGLWFCRMKNDEKFEYKMISNDCSFNNFFKLNCSLNLKGVKDMWNKTKDVSTEEDRLRFLDK